MAALGVARVIQGTTTIPSGNASVDVTLSPAVNKSKTLRECRPIVPDTWSPERAFITWEISSDGSKLTITRAGTPNVALPVKYSIVEFAAGVTVEELSFTTGASWGGTHDETISAVTLARTAVIPSYRVAESTTSPTTHYLARFELTSDTNLRVTSKDSDLALSCIVQLLKFDSDSGVTVQQVTEALAQSVLTSDVTISAVDLAHTLVSGSSETTSSSAQDLHTCGWTTLTDSTTLHHERRGSSGTWTVTSWVMDFGGGAAQRGVTTHGQHSNATRTQDISTVDLDNSTVHIGMGPWPACHYGATSANWQYRLFYAELTSPTQITFTRGAVAASVTGQSWQVMDWTALMTGDEPVSVTGSPSIGSPTSDGALAALVALSGAPALADLTAEGVVNLLVSLSGTPSLTAIQAEGLLSTPAVSVTGSPTIGNITADGAFAALVSITGTPSLGAVLADGVVVHEGAASFFFGAPSVAPLSAAGLIGTLVAVSGNSVVGPVEVAGTIRPLVSLSGTPTMYGVTSSGLIITLPPVELAHPLRLGVQPVTHYARIVGVIHKVNIRG